MDKVTKDEMMKAAQHISYTDWYKKYRDELLAFYREKYKERIISKKDYKDWCEGIYDSI